MVSLETVKNKREILVGSLTRKKMDDYDVELNLLTNTIQNLANASIIRDHPTTIEWVQKLASSGQTNRKNATDYARYLNFMLRRGDLQYPFDVSPHEEPLQDFRDLLKSKRNYREQAGKRPFSKSAIYVANSTSFRHSIPQRQSETLLSQRNLSTLPPGTLTIAEIRSDGNFDERVERPSSTDRINYPLNKNSPLTLSNQSDIEFVRSCIIASELEEIPDGASLDVLISVIGPLTRDRGAILRAVAAEELDEFAELATAAWRARERNSEDTLIQQHTSLHRQYGKWSARMEARAEQCRRIILESLPDFDIDLYRTDPDYLRRHMEEKSYEVFEDHLKSWKNGSLEHLAYLRNQTVRLEKEHDDLRSQLEKVRERHIDLQQAQAARERKLVQENADIERELKQTKQAINENTQIVENLLRKLEDRGKRVVARRLEYEEADETEGTSSSKEDTREHIPEIEHDAEESP